MIEYDKVGSWYRVTKGFYMKTDIIPPKPIRSKFSSLGKAGTIRIRKGFCWDGATGAIDTKNILEASCLHDAFCNWYNQKLITKENRKQADRLFKAKLKETNMSKFRIKYLYQAVRKFFEIRH